MLNRTPDRKIEGNTLIISEETIKDENGEIFRFNSFLAYFNYFEKKFKEEFAAVAKIILENNIKELKLYHRAGILFAAGILSHLPAQSSLIAIELIGGIDLLGTFSSNLITALKKHASKGMSLSIIEDDTNNPDLRKLIVDVTAELGSGSLALERLNISLNYASAEIDDTAFSNLASALKEYANLNCLEIIYNEMEIGKIINILDALKFNTSLKKLSLSGFNSSSIDEVSPCFKDMFKENKTLETLELNANDLEDEDIEKLGLKESSSLTTLSLCSSFISDDGVEIILNNMPKNLNSILLLHNSACTKAGFNHLLARLIEEKRGDLEIHYNDSQFTHSDYSSILEKIKDNDFFTAPLNPTSPKAREVNSLLTARRQQAYCSIVSLLAGSNFNFFYDDKSVASSKKHDYDSADDEDMPVKRNKTI